MTEHDLTTLVREHVAHDEPPFRMSADTAIALGRRTLVRRRARRGLAGVIVAAAAVTLPMVLNGSPMPAGDGGRIDPLTAAALDDYDPAAMPGIIERRAAAVLARSGTDLGPATFTAADGQGNALPPKLYDKASSMEVRYGGKGDHRFRVSLMHARSEAEGDAREVCADDLATGYAFSCTVSTSAAGDPVTTRVLAVRPVSGFPGSAWGALTRQELRTGVPAKGNPSMEPIDPDEVYFLRSVESVHSESFLTSANEVVRAPDLATARTLWEVPVADLQAIVTDPELVIPEPPIDDRGCPWTLPKSDVTCATDPS